MNRSTSLSFITILLCQIIGLALAINLRAQGNPLGEIEGEYEIHAIGRYSGFADVEVRLDSSPNQTKEIPVLVNQPGKRVLLVLTAYDPVVWNVGWTEGSDIIGVLASGYHGQAVIGIEEGTPLAFSSYYSPGAFPYFYAYSASSELVNLKDQVKQLFGQDLARFHFQPSGNRFVVGDELEEGEQVLRSDFLNIDDYGQGIPLSGPEQLEAFESDGILRRVTQVEIDDWTTKASEPYVRFNPGLTVRPRLSAGRSYAITQATTLPDGLTGALSQSFYLVEGVSFPDGPRGHNRFYFADGTQEGVGVSPHGPDRDHDDSALEPLFADLPEDFRLYAVGGVLPKTTLDIQLDQSGDHVGQVEIIINEPDAPVILVLSGHDPTVWNIGLTEGTQVSGVILSGYDKQVLIGLPTSVPVMVSTHEEPGEFDAMRVSGATRELLWMNDRLKALGGKDLDYFYTYWDSEDRIYRLGQEMTEGQEVIYSDERQINDQIDPAQPLAGQEGLDQLVAEGKLRVVTGSDIRAWIEQESEMFQGIAPGIEVSFPRRSGTYVVMGDLILPNGLYGAHSKVFLIPSGIPFPSGSRGHNVFLELNGGLEEVVAQLDSLEDSIDPPEEPEVTPPVVPPSSGEGVLGVLPEELEIHAVGTYRGFSSVEIQLDDSGHEVTEAEVLVNKPGKEIVLVLTAYDPVVWKVSWTESTNITGVIASGYHGQAVLGVGGDLPLAISTHETPGDFEHFYAYRPSPELLEMDEKVEGLLGLGLSRFHFEAVDEKFFVGEVPQDDETIINSDDLSLDDYRLPDARPVGQAGLDLLEQGGSIRRATMADLNAWVEAASAPFLQFNEKLRIKAPMIPSRTYVVLEQVTLPDGLYGAHSHSFILAEGVEMPDGPRGHNRFYTADGGTIPGHPGHGGEGENPMVDDSALAPLFSDLLEDFRIYAVGAYKGSALLEGVQLDQSGHEVRQGEVIVNEPDRPVILVLSAYDPVVWNVGVTEGTQIAGVILSGYHAQAILGVSAEVPQLISTSRERGAFEPMVVTGAGESLLQMNARLEVLSGRELDFFAFETTEGIFELGLPRQGNEEIFYSDDLSLEDYLDPDAPLAGQAALDQFLEEGKIRPVTVADIEAWIDQESEAYQELVPGVRISAHFNRRFTYVVLAPITLPNGLYGAHSRAFMIPSDVPFPEGPRGHNRFFELPVSLATVNQTEVVDYLEEIERGTFVEGFDSDGDGLKDSLEFLMGTNPQDAASKGELMVALEYLQGAPFLCLELPLRKNGTGLMAVLESSSDGLLWEEVKDGFETVNCSTLSDCQNRVRFRSSRPVDEPVRFYRLRVR